MNSSEGTRARTTAIAQLQTWIREIKLSKIKLTVSKQSCANIRKGQIKVRQIQIIVFQHAIAASVPLCVWAPSADRYSAADNINAPLRPLFEIKE